MKRKRLAVLLIVLLVAVVVTGLLVPSLNKVKRYATPVMEESIGLQPPASDSPSEEAQKETSLEGPSNVNEPAGQLRTLEFGETRTFAADELRTSEALGEIYSDGYVSPTPEEAARSMSGPSGVKPGDTDLSGLGGWRSSDRPTSRVPSRRETMGGMGGSSSQKPRVVGTPRDARGRVAVLGDTPQVSQLRTNTPMYPKTWGDITAVDSAAARDYIDLTTVTTDEIWVIARPEAPPAGSTEYETPGSGAMLATIDEKEIPLPLKHTDVKGQISGYIATVHVTQQFHNPYDAKIEAVYVFPLPQNAAVNEFIMVIGERKIRGIIRERKEAEQIYAEARRQGHVASLLTQERPNIFTQKVANIEPGKMIDVDIKYFNTLAYVDGWYEFTFPMVVGPRFNPPGSTEGVGAVGRGKTSISGQTTEVQYLKPNERSGHDIALALDIDAGVAIEELKCASHAITNSTETPEKRHVQLSPLDSIPNKDFVLRYKVAGQSVKSALVTHQDQRGGFFTLMLYPPNDLQTLKRAPMEMVFVLDCSGSMRGKPMAKAKDAIRRALRKLEPGDTFQVIRFSQNASQFGPRPVPATKANVRQALDYVDKLRGSGGTMMIEGVKAALDFPHDDERFRFVCFMTDGYIGNEAQILGAVHERLGASRIFSFGVGSSVNRYLLDRMAKLGKGAVAYVGLQDDSSEIVDSFYDRISHPALTDVAIDWGNLEVEDVYPSQIPDLFVGRPLILTGRFRGQENTTVRITGKVGHLDRQIEIPTQLDGTSATHPSIACVWARKKIEQLASRATYDRNNDLPGEITQRPPSNTA